MQNPNSTALAFFAHPDDAEFLCAGTLARLRARGCTIHCATMTAGDGGSAELPPAEIARLRLNEAAQAAAVLDGTHQWAGTQDLLVCYDQPTLRRVIEIVRRVNPQLVFTHSPQDYLLDHEVTSQLVRAACFAASVPNVQTLSEAAAPALARVPHLYYSDALEGKDSFGAPVPPGFYVDISETIETKARMLACHTSQRTWLLRQHGMDQYLQAMRDWSAQRGAEAGVAYAEAFRQHLGHAYPQTNLLADVLGVLPANAASKS
ncbi:MAG: PIG-L family deacetylase [Acidobacteria bacterium]|nr:PIG-L family deacetylase [Acidobacteriota bacterium]MBI3424414.1 PIG-L family deacetylase [Acidobacteriota bacterium]